MYQQESAKQTSPEVPLVGRVGSEVEQAPHEQLQRAIAGLQRVSEQLYDLRSRITQEPQPESNEACRAPDQSLREILQNGPTSINKHSEHVYEQILEIERLLFSQQ